MITNILCSVVVALVTNTSERVSMHQVADPAPPGEETLAVYRCHMEPDADPQTRWERTTVSRAGTASFNYGGRPYAGVQLFSDVVSDQEVELHKHVFQMPAMTGRMARTNITMTVWEVVKTNDVMGKIFLGEWYETDRVATNSTTLVTNMNWTVPLIMESK